MAIARTDFDVRQDILSELSNDVRIVNPGNITVDVVSGVVYLRGTAPDFFQKQVAGEDANRIKGVLNVVNELQVTLPSPTPDQQVTNQVRAALDRDITLNLAPITVNTVMGVVYLAGNVDAFFKKTQAARDAWTVPGVVDVVNNIVVQPAPPIPTDQQIADSVRSFLWGDVRIEMANVTVTVTNGVVYLRGSVPTFSQKLDATNDAWLANGVVDVVNELAVIP